VGSSPRARGAGHPSVVRRVWFRIIPACAGSSGDLLRRCWDRRDHPRVRGEQLHGYFKRDGYNGSSPRARGAVSHPALHWPPSKDHPRVRGEQVPHRILDRSSQGSSPRARGAGVEDLDDGGAAGIIPACAGSRCQRSPETACGRTADWITGGQQIWCVGGHSGVCVRTAGPACGRTRRWGRVVRSAGSPPCRPGPRRVGVNRLWSIPDARGATSDRRSRWLMSWA